MNENSYKKYIVSNYHCFCDAGIILDYMLSYHKEKSDDWDMVISHFSNYNGMLIRYNVGYCLQPYDNFYYLKYNNSNYVPWVNNEWLPNWGKLTKKKSNLINSIKNFYINNKKMLLYIKLNVPGLIEIIFSYL